MTRPYFFSDALENIHPQLSRLGDELITRFSRRPGDFTTFLTDLDQSGSSIFWINTSGRKRITATRSERNSWPP
jgi:hypothetical protein